MHGSLVFILWWLGAIIGGMILGFITYHIFEKESNENKKDNT